MGRKQLVADQIRQIEKARLEQLKEVPKTGLNLMVLLLVRVIGIGIETPTCVRRGMIQLAWRFLKFQNASTLAKWFETRTENVRGSRKKMIVALAASCSSPCGTSYAMACCPRASSFVRHTEGRGLVKNTWPLSALSHLATGRRR